ncbi:MAG: arylesterase [Gemmatimonadota bacterium]|nr:MAG: arylesterase [Gemmatimonadota bacterium]
MCSKILLGSVLFAAVTGCVVEHSEQADAASHQEALSDSAVRPAVLFLGTSLTAGMGVGVQLAYPALIQQNIDSAALPFRVVNAGESGGTSAGGVRRVDWLLRQPVAVLVLELGANDGLRGQDVDSLRINLQVIIDRTLAKYPEAEVVIAGMEAPPNLGRIYTEAFRQVFVDIAWSNDAALIPFLLEGVAGVPDLNQSDGIHPTAEGQRLMADNVWRVLEPLLADISQRVAVADPSI